MTADQVWLNGEHLHEAALAEHRSAFSSSPARLTVLREVLLPEAAERLAEFLGSGAEYRTEYGLYSVDHSVPEAQWRLADESDRFFRLRRLAGIRAGAQFAPSTLAYLQFRRFLGTAPVVALFEDICQMALFAADDIGAQAMGAGDFLRSHDDDNRNRRVAFVLYLSPGWHPELGGSLHVVDPTGDRYVVEPECNSMVIFDVRAGTTHEVRPISAAAGKRRRVTLGGWFHGSR